MFSRVQAHMIQNALKVVKIEMYQKKKYKKLSLQSFIVHSATKKFQNSGYIVRHWTIIAISSYQLLNLSKGQSINFNYFCSFTPRTIENMHPIKSLNSEWLCYKHSFKDENKLCFVVGIYLSNEYHIYLQLQNYQVSK